MTKKNIKTQFAALVLLSLIFFMPSGFAADENTLFIEIDGEEIKIQDPKLTLKATITKPCTCEDTGLPEGRISQGVLWAELSNDAHNIAFEIKEGGGLGERTFTNQSVYYSNADKTIKYKATDLGAFSSIQLIGETNINLNNFQCLPDGGLIDFSVDATLAREKIDASLLDRNEDIYNKNDTIKIRGKIKANIVYGYKDCSGEK